jgi:hypothetical protein
LRTLWQKYSFRGTKRNEYFFPEKAAGWLAAVRAIVKVRYGGQEA